MVERWGVLSFRREPMEAFAQFVEGATARVMTKVSSLMVKLSGMMAREFVQFLDSCFKGAEGFFDEAFAS
jgi:hypothetical protein